MWEISRESIIVVLVKCFGVERKELSFCVIEELRGVLAFL